MVNLFQGVPRQFGDDSYGAVLQPDDLAPTTKQVVGTYIEDAFLGDLTMNQLQEADQLHGYEREGEAMDKDQWEKSEYHRPGIEYYNGMTDQSAQFLANKKDAEDARAEIYSRANSWQSAAGVAAGFAAGIFEPLNIGVGLVTMGIGNLVTDVGRIGRTVKSLSQTGKYVPALVKGAAEGAAAAVLTEGVTYNARNDLQSDYDVTDSLFNFATSIALGSGLRAGGEFFKDRSTAKDIARQQGKLEGATQQVLAGKRVDVGAIQDMMDIHDMPHIENIIRNSFEEGAVTKDRLNELLNYKEYTGVEKRGVDVFEKVKSSVENIDKQLAEKTEALKKISTPENFDSLLAAEGYPVMVKAGLVENINNYIAARALEREQLDPGKSGKRHRVFDEETAAKLNDMRENLKSFNQLNDSGRNASVAQQIQTQKKSLVTDIKVLQQQKSDVLSQNFPTLEEMLAQMQGHMNDKVERVKNKVKDYQDVTTDSIFSDEDLNKDPQFFNSSDDVDVTGRAEEVEKAVKDLDALGLVSEDEKAYIEKLNSVKEEDLAKAFSAAEACLTRG